jgi:hypothetical protein
MWLVPADQGLNPVKDPVGILDSVLSPCTRYSGYRPAPVTDRRQRQQDPPHQEPQVPDCDVSAQRCPVRPFGGVDDPREDEGAGRHVKTAVYHQ